MVSEQEILGECARFLDSGPARALDPKGKEAARKLVQAWLSAAYDGLGKAPALLDGHDVQTVLTEVLPAHLGVGDPLARDAEAVLGAFLAYQEETHFTPHAYEQRQALETHLPEFLSLVRSGTLAGRARALPARPLVHRAEKVGRNDPCPCGSGKKFKACCARLGS